MATPVTLPAPSKGTDRVKVSVPARCHITKTPDPVIKPIPEIWWTIAVRRMFGREVRIQQRLIPPGASGRNIGCILRGMLDSETSKSSRFLERYLLLQSRVVRLVPWEQIAQTDDIEPSPGSRGRLYHECTAEIDNALTQTLFDLNGFPLPINLITQYPCLLNTLYQSSTHLPLIDRQLNKKAVGYLIAAEMVMTIIVGIGVGLCQQSLKLGMIVVLPVAILAVVLKTGLKRLE